MTKQSASVSIPRCLGKKRIGCIPFTLAACLGLSVGIGQAVTP